MRDFASLGFRPFPDAIFYLFVGELVENYWGKLVGFSSVKDVDFIQCNLKSVSIFSYYWLFLGSKTYRVYHALLYSRQTCEILRARDCDLFPTIYLISLSEKIAGKWRGSCQLRMLTSCSLIWSLFQFLVTIDYFLGKKHIEYIYAPCIDPTGRRGAK